MTKEETTQILAIISAFGYGKTKADAEDVINAWHVALKEYDYIVVEQAVIEFAKNDRREYSQFPTVGLILESIEDEERCLVRIRNWALDGKPYEELGKRAQKWISEERYERLKNCGEDYLLNNLDTIKHALKKEQILLK